MNVLDGLQRISERHEHHINDSTIPKRGSVAVILKIPNFTSSSTTTSSILNDLVNCPNVDEAEVLFILRAASERDRWSAQIAVPGGRRDPADADDQEAAVREAKEEVGLDLKSKAVYIGPLDQRLVKVSFGSKPIMILCPFVYVMTQDQPLEIQPSEVATAFYIPIKKLVDPKSASYEQVKIGERLTSPKVPSFINSAVKYSVSDLLFGSITLNPTELAENSNVPRNPPYKLWGLTLAFMTDFFELVSPGMTVKMIKMPTYKAFDARFILWLISRRYLSTKHQEITLSSRKGYNAGEMDYVSRLLDGYFKYLKRAAILSFIFRASIVGFALYRFLSSRR